MPRNTKRQNEDEPDPEPVSADLELNLAFAPTKDLVNELLNRCAAAVVAYQVTDTIMESEPTEQNAKFREGGRWTATNYTGDIASCVGLAEVLRHDLLKQWTED